MRLLEALQGPRQACAATFPATLQHCQKHETLGLRRATSRQQRGECEPLIVFKERIRPEEWGPVEFCPGYPPWEVWIWLTPTSNFVVPGDKGLDLRGRAPRFLRVKSQD